MIIDLNAMLPQPYRDVPPELHKRYTEHYSKVMQEKFNYRRTDTNAKGFDAVASYTAHWRAAEEKKCDYPRQGLFLFGTPGTGKTTAMQLLSGFCQIEFVPTDFFSKVFSLNSGSGFWNLAADYCDLPLIVDDLGCEQSAKSFGNLLPMADFIRERERLWQAKGICTCFTSNAQNREELISRYGQNICSRLMGMCKFVQFSGADNRLKRN